MKVKIKKNNLAISLILFIIFLFSVSIFDLAGYMLTILFPLYFLFVNNKNINVDKGLVCLLIYSFTYFISDVFYDNLSIDLIVKFLCAPWLLYLLGRDIVNSHGNKEYMHKIVIIAVWGFFIHGLLNLNTYIQNFGVSYFSSSNFRLSFDYWRNETISVTVCSFYYLPMICYAIGYLIFGKNRTKKIIYFIGFLLGLYANLLYSNRTAIYIIAILLTIGLFIVLRNSQIKLQNFLVFVILIIAIFGVFYFDLYGIRTWIMSLGITNRLMSNDIGRLSLWIVFILGDWLFYPFGGYTASSSYAHNLWLDTLRAVGIIPFIALLLFTFYALNIAKELYKNSKELALPYIFMLFGILMSFMVEPVTDANPYYFLLTILIIGSIRGFNMRNSRKERNKG